MAVRRQCLGFRAKASPGLSLKYGLSLSVLGCLVSLPARAGVDMPICLRLTDRSKHVSDVSPPPVIGVPVCLGSMDRIMGVGSTSEAQLVLFLQSVNPEAASLYRDLAKLYREEAAIEGVNHDVAFCQMLVETNLLSWGGRLSPASNNFGGIGSLNGGLDGASFPSARVGVRAHIQHLKVYASLDSLVQRQVDPRRGYVMRGESPLITQLTGRWNADPEYGSKIAAFLHLLYESVGLM